MRIQLHNRYEDTLIELSEASSMRPTDYIKQLLLEKYEALEDNQLKEASIAQGADNGRQVQSI